MHSQVQGLVLVKGEVHTFSILKYVNVLTKLERTKKNAAQKLFSFSDSRASKLSISRHILDDVTGFKNQFLLYGFPIKRRNETFITFDLSKMKA